ncbi:MAG: hypothetical protein V4812_01720 [Pseudomonadota bacterium]
MSKLLWMGGAVAFAGAALGFVWLPSLSAPAPGPAVAQQVPLPAPLPSAALPAAVAAAAEAQPLQPKPAVAAVAPDTLDLWDAAQLREGAEDGIPVFYATLPPALLNSLHIGQTLSLALPGRRDPLRALLDQTRNGSDVAIWQGSLVDGDPAETLTVVRGALETHLSVATLQGSYSVIIDNRSGKAVITDENELAARANPHGDAVDFQDGEQPRPPVPG